MFDYIRLLLYFLLIEVVFTPAPGYPNLVTEVETGRVSLLVLGWVLLSESDNVLVVYLRLDFLHFLTWFEPDDFRMLSYIQSLYSRRVCLLFPKLWQHIGLFCQIVDEATCFPVELMFIKSNPRFWKEMTAMIEKNQQLMSDLKLWSYFYLLLIKVCLQGKL